MDFARLARMEDQARQGKIELRTADMVRGLTDRQYVARERNARQRIAAFDAAFSALTLDELRAYGEYRHA